MAVSGGGGELHVVLPRTVAGDRRAGRAKRRRSEFIREAIAEKLDDLRRMRTRRASVCRLVDDGEIPELGDARVGGEMSLLRFEKSVS